MKKSISCLLLMLTPLTHADYKFGFADASFNRLNWTPSTKEKSFKQDFNYLELEGGANYSWGEVYGFFDLENPGREADRVRSAAKGTLAYYLGQTHLSAYVQVYNFSMNGLSEQNQVAGLQYQFNGANYWFRPFVGFHEAITTFYTGANGFMAGWTLGYAFKLWGLGWLFADWHEFEFGRNAQYAALNGGSSGTNGAASLWLNATPHFALGVQWRYAINKLGTAGTEGAEIYTFKYNF